MADAVFLVTQFAAAGLLALLAFGLLLIRFQSRINRSFALFLFLQSLFLGLGGLRRLEAGDGGRMEVYWGSLQNYVGLSLVPSALYFLAVYRRPDGSRATRAAGIALLALTAAVEAAFLTSHCSVQCPEGAGIHVGPLLPFGLSISLVLGLAALVLARDNRKVEGPRRRAIRIVALGFAATAVLDGSLGAIIAASGGLPDYRALYAASAWADLALAVRIAALPVGCVALLALALGDPEAKTRKRYLRASMAVVALAALTAVATEAEGIGADAGPTWSVLLVGLWRILLAGLITYALVRHRLFGLDLKIKWTVQRATIVGVFLAVFFVVGKLTESWAERVFGSNWVVGAVAAGLLLFAISPLQRLADLVANSLLPHARPVREMEEPERLRLFREQAVMVWSDGVTGRKERILLDNLRERLGITPADAARIEHEAAVAAPAPAAARRASAAL